MQETDNPEEVLDLVDEDDRVIGSESRSEIYRKGLTNFRVVNIFVRNTRDQLWIPRRTASKKLFPLCLDMSAAGHVESGETYEEAAAKEVREEIRIDVSKHPLNFLGHASPKEHGVSAHMHTFEILSDEAPDYNSDDFCEWYWMSPQEIVGKVTAGEQAKSDLVKLVNLFYL